MGSTRSSMAELGFILIYSFTLWSLVVYLFALHSFRSLCPHICSISSCRTYQFVSPILCLGAALVSGVCIT